MWQVTLADQQPIAQGGVRRVFEHPHDPSLLIKVVRADVFDTKFGAASPWYKSRYRRYRQYISYLRETREQIALYATGKPHPPFVQRIVGFAETDLGPGLMVVAERDAAGQLAPTLRQLVTSGRFSGQLARELEAFFAALDASDVMTGDLNSHNIVYGRSQGLSDRFVIIDGLGFKTVIPLERMSRRINRVARRAQFAKLRKQIAHLEAARGQRESAPGSAAAAVHFKASAGGPMP